MVQRVKGIAVGIAAASVAAAFFGAFGLGVAAFAQQPLVEKFVLSDTIQPVTAGELDRAIARANTEGAQALLIELDTPGGLLDSTRGMVGAILASRVPVIVYVAPEALAPVRPASFCWSRRTWPPWLPAPTPERRIR
jgi:membrane-bound ClpP family serine protease